MSELFPFDQAGSTVFYTVLYLLTLVIHAIFMSYVLAGSLWLGVQSIARRQRSADQPENRVNAVMRDWMPFVLSAAITAGVAPLLFIQLLYPHAYYTANLLLNWRWMVVVPVITISFYLLYVQKSRRLQDSTVSLRALVTLTTAASFLFVAFCWTANHQLSLDAERWPDVFAGESAIASGVQLLSRLLTWVAGTFPVMAIFVRWQVAGSRTDSVEGQQSERKPLAVVAMSGLIGAAICASIYLWQLPETVTGQIADRGGWIWGGAAMIGVILQFPGWWPVLRDGRDSTLLRSLTTAGCLLTLTSVAVVREIIRSASLSSAGVKSSAADAAEIGGFGIFLLFALINTVLCGFCIWLILPAIRKRKQEVTDQAAK